MHDSFELIDCIRGHIGDNIISDLKTITVHIFVDVVATSEYNKNFIKFLIFHFLFVETNI